MSMLLFAGLGLLLLAAGGSKKKGGTPAAASVDVNLPDDPADAREVARDAVAEVASRDHDTPAAATPAAATAEHAEPAAAATVAPPSLRVEIGPAVIKPDAYVVTPKPGPDVAKKSAQATADHVRSKGSKYDRARLAAWQAAAGLRPDGLYGPGTVSKLKGLGAKNVIGPLFKGAKK